jgi:hypothetical protein
MKIGMNPWPSARGSKIGLCRCYVLKDLRTLLIALRQVKRLGFTKKVYIVVFGQGEFAAMSCRRKVGRAERHPEAIASDREPSGAVPFSRRDTSGPSATGLLILSARCLCKHVGASDGTRTRALLRHS